jgi:hypothetical protein
VPVSEMDKGGGATRERALHPSGEDGCKPQVPGAPPGGSVRAGPHRPLNSNRWGPAQLLTVLLSERRSDDLRCATLPSVASGYVATPDRNRHGMCSVTRLELCEQVPDVGFHRLLTDVETDADFAVGEAIGHELKHGELTVAGPVRRQFAERHPWDDRRRMRRRACQAPAIDAVQHPDLFALGGIHHLLKRLRPSSPDYIPPLGAYWGLTSALGKLSHARHAFAYRRRAVEQSCGTAGRSDMLGMNRRTDTTGRPTR